MVLKGLENSKKLYFIGIGGISMSALAKFCVLNGYEVSGSDGVRSEQTEDLAFYGIKVFISVSESRAELLQADMIIYTDAISKEHVERKVAESMQKTLLSRMQFLKIVSQNFESVAAISGSHGKTTCTSMCAHIFKEANAPFAAHIGGEDHAFGNFYFSGFEYLVTEACEYKRNFLQLTPDRAVVLNVDRDHMECYKNEEDLMACFSAFCRSANAAFVCVDDPKCQKLGDFSTFGIQNPLADYRAVDLRANGERYSFTVEEYGKPLCRIKLNAVGRCNVYNALAAFALSRSYGFSEIEIKRGLERFEAVKRRFEKIGNYRGASVICDYAHHPREIMSTIATANGICKGKLYVVFQPHTYSRTRLLMEEFINALRPVENVMIYKTYPARETFEREGSGESLAKRIGNCLYAENVYVLKTWINKTAKEGDILLFLGAGDIYHVAQYLLKELK